MEKEWQKSWKLVYKVQSTIPVKSKDTKMEKTHDSMNLLKKEILEPEWPEAVTRKI